jgi:hypothetical protein
MRKIILITLVFLALTSCASVEERIKDNNLTNEWYYIDTMRFQVYKTDYGKRYIVVLNNRQTRYKRQYLD